MVSKYREPARLPLLISADYDYVPRRSKCKESHDAQDTQSFATMTYLMNCYPVGCNSNLKLAELDQRAPVVRQVLSRQQSEVLGRASAKQTAIMSPGFPLDCNPQHVLFPANERDDIEGLRARKD